MPRWLKDILAVCIVLYRYYYRIPVHSSKDQPLTLTSLLVISIGFGLFLFSRSRCTRHSSFLSFCRKSTCLRSNYPVSRSHLISCRRLKLMFADTYGVLLDRVTTKIEILIYAVNIRSSLTFEFSKVFRRSRALQKCYTFSPFFVKVPLSGRSNHPIEVT